MKNINNKDKYFRSSSFPLTCFLFAKGSVLVNVDKTLDPRRYQFVFINSPELQKLVHVFNFSLEDESDTLVDARKVIASVKKIKDLIKSF